MSVNPLLLRITYTNLHELVAYPYSRAPSPVSPTLRSSCARTRLTNAIDQSDFHLQPTPPWVSRSFDRSIALSAACALVFESREQPNGYTEGLLRKYRLDRQKAGGFPTGAKRHRHCVAGKSRAFCQRPT